MSRRAALVTLLAVLAVVAACQQPVRSDMWSWKASLEPQQYALTDLGFGTGFSNSGPYRPTGLSGIAIASYRQGTFYQTDYSYGVSPGWSVTRSNIYLWAQNTTLSGNTVLVSVGPVEPAPPRTYRAQLVLDYVPASLNWMGPTQFDNLQLWGSTFLSLPVPVVTDPLQGVRMHLTVYDTAPEPSSLMGLAAGLSALAGVGLRRRRR